LCEAGFGGVKKLILSASRLRCRREKVAEILVICARRNTDGGSADLADPPAQKDAAHRVRQASAA